MPVTPPRPKNIALVGMAMYGQDAGIVRGVAAFAQQHNWHLHMRDGRLREVIELKKNLPIDGIIAHVTNRKLARALQRFDVPIINVSGWDPGKMGMPFVVHEVDQAGKMAAEYFLRRGYTSFACEPAPFRFQEVAVSLGTLAFGRTVREAGFVCHELTQSLAYTRQGVHADPLPDFPTASVLELPRPLAVFVMGDRLASRLNALCLESRLSIPDQVSVLGFGNIDLVCETAYPPLSSIQTDDVTLGRQASKILYQWMKGHAPGRHENLIPPLGIVTRRSSDALAIEDPRVARAVHYIRDADLSEIDCDQVAVASGVNRRTLERKFKQTLGHSLYTEIQQWRCDRARHHLQTTTLPLKHVAAVSGFRDADHMGKVLRKHLGKTPRQLKKARPPHPLD